VYHIDKGLSIFSTEATDRLYLVLTCEDCFNQRNDLVWKGGIINQAFVGRCAEVNGDG
jgi:hypothetical protein